MKNVILSICAAVAITGCQQTTYEMSAANVQKLKTQAEAFCTQRGFKPGTIAHRDCSWAYGHRYNDMVYNNRAVAATNFANALDASNARNQAYANQVNGMTQCKYYKPRVHAAGRAPIYTNCY